LKSATGPRWANVPEWDVLPYPFVPAEGIIGLYDGQFEKEILP
jgi:hypothetical protein